VFIRVVPGINFVAKKVSQVELERKIGINEWRTLSSDTLIRNFCRTQGQSWQSPPDLRIPQQTEYIFDCALVVYLKNLTTDGERLDFLGPFEDFVKEQFLLSLLHKYTLELHQTGLQRWEFLPFSKAIEGISKYISLLKPGFDGQMPTDAFIDRYRPPGPELRLVRFMQAVTMAVASTNSISALF
jgi:hypothetical protein